MSQRSGAWDLGAGASSQVGSLQQRRGSEQQQQPQPQPQQQQQRPLLHASSHPASPSELPPPGYGPSSRRASEQRSPPFPLSAPPSRPPSRPTSSLGPHASMSSRSSRSSDVHNILNPSPAAEQVETVPARRNAAQMESPSTASVRYTPSALSRAPFMTDHALGGPLGAAALGPLSPALPGGQAPRRIVKVHSPALRAVSLNSVSLPGTIDAQLSPFLSSQNRTFSVDPAGSQDVTPLPTPPALSKLQQGSSYNFPPTAPTPPPGGRRLSHGTTQSQSASPSTSFSSFSQPSHASPAPQYGPGMAPTGSMAGFSQPNYGAASTPASGPPTPMTAGGSYRGASNAYTQSNYQLLTLDTSQGPIQVPVDVQAASKVADDKRKRNAGASARFRQRRKEKEREASQTISKLEQQIRDVTEEREYYRQERDHFRRLASGTLGPAVMAQRPPSPAPRHYPFDVNQPRAASISGTWSDAGQSQSEAETTNGGRRMTEPYLPPPPTYTQSVGSLASGPSPAGPSSQQQPPPQQYQPPPPPARLQPPSGPSTVSRPDAPPVIPTARPEPHDAPSSYPPAGWYADRGPKAS